jgi:glycosyltransferase involved in cell wall biosynthesis
MPTYNAMPHLKDAVESILAQTYSTFEFLIVYDGSTDDSMAYLSSLTDSRVRLLINQEKRGIVAALNRGIAEARYNWIARMDADDVALPHRLEKQVEFVLRNPEYSLISCAWGYIGANNSRFKASQFHNLTSPPIYQPLIDPMILDQGMLFNKEAVTSIGGYTGASNSEGMDLCLRLDEAGYLMTSVPDLLMLVRVLQGGVTSKNFIEQRLLWKYSRACSQARRMKIPEPEQDKFLREHWPRGWKRLKIEGAKQFRLAGGSWGAGNYFDAAVRLLLSLILRPDYVFSKFQIYFFNT